MLRNTPSRRVVIACLIMAISSLYLRNQLYQDIPIDTEPIELEARGREPSTPPIRILYHERAPYYFTNEQSISGLCGEPAEKAFQGAGITYILQPTPPKRQLEILIRNTERNCSIGWLKTTGRKSFARFTHPIYQDKPTLALARIDTPLAQQNLMLDQLLTNRELTLLVKEGYSYGEFIDRKLLQASPPTITTTGNDSNMLRMIVAGRADYFFIAAEEALALIEQEHASDLVQMVHLADMPAGNKRYIMCSKMVSESEIQLLNMAIERDTAITD